MPQTPSRRLCSGKRVRLNKGGFALLLLGISIVNAEAQNVPVFQTKNNDTSQLLLSWSSGIAETSGASDGSLPRTSPGISTYDPLWQQHTAWIWKERESDGVRIPILRTWIAVPEHYEIQAIDLEPTVPLEVVRSASGFPRTLKYPAEVIAIDVKDSFTPGMATFFLVDKKTKKSFKIILNLSLKPTYPTVVLDPHCDALGVSLAKRSGNTEFFFIAATCEDSYNKITLNLFKSSDSTWVESSGEELKEGGLRHVLSKPKYFPDSPVGIAELKLEHKSGTGPTSQFVAFFKAGKGKSPLQLGLNASATYLSYEEASFTSVSLNQFAMTAKARIGLTVVPRLLLVDASGFITALPITSTTRPSGLPSAYFYGVNGRLGVDLPVGLGSTHWTILGGWYWWGMMVSGNAYGIQSLFGPQLFISTRTQALGTRSWGAYVKVAPVGTGSLSFASRELAIGGSYQINSPSSSSEWALTLDFSQMTFASIPSAPVNVSLYTYSLGLQHSF